jgi:WD40 repeat protein
MVLIGVFQAFDGEDQHQAMATDICFSPINQLLLASAGFDKKIQLYDVNKQR